ncbi:MAG: hypothetical protein IPO78_04765 [Saprospiraceae bacterium]|nr:hypothetical protein [Saprospiraceae bacterium]MBK8449165.1 hypothetical protein [Saprospiraceae bacterium]MBK8484783.1 hypothetical protein [Saprospiraceae bacterium]MBK9222176.1 hypothetical protein [Saprospiraceae bacterium]MBK9720914.1 hypothetical protein [Saprospiraceae bacterium]
MLINKNFIILIISIFTLSLSCTSEFISDGRQICFEQEVLPILVSTCTQSGCHNSDDHEAGYDYTDLNSILSSVKPGNYSGSELYKVLTDPFQPMPPSPFNRLTKEQIFKISLWIEQGAENLPCIAPACDTTEVSYNATVFPILQLYCNGCHAGPRPQGDVDYNSFSGLKATITDGRFIGSILHEIGYIGMPKNGNKMPECEILQIQKWVRDGAKNN